MIAIRPYSPELAPLVYVAAAESVSEVSRFLRGWWRNFSLRAVQTHVAESAQAWQTGEFYDFAITPASSDAPFLGRVGVDHPRWPEGAANVGYWVRTSRTGAGIATRAVRLLAHFAFEDLGLTRLEFLIATDNPASRRVAEKAGGVLEGIRPADGHRLEHDSWCYVLSRSAR